MYTKSYTTSVFNFNKCFCAFYCLFNMIAVSHFKAFNEQFVAWLIIILQFIIYKSLHTVVFAAEDNTACVRVVIEDAFSCM